MKIVEIDIQEPYFSYIQSGQKTIETRLNKGKFKFLEIGDILRINNQANFEIIDKKLYSSFRDMIIKEGIENIVPDKDIVEDAINICYQFYSKKQEKEFGVMALRIKKSS